MKYFERWHEMVDEGIAKLNEWGDMLKEKGMSLALEVAMCAEFLHTVIDSEWKSLLALGATIVLRAAMSLLLHFEKTNEKKEAREEEDN